MIKKLLSIILSVAVALTMMPAMTTVSFADTTETITYIDENGEEQTASCIVLEQPDSQATDDYSFADGKWYAVKGAVTVNNRIENIAAADTPAHLILEDGAELIAPKGIYNAAGKGLIIYGQKNQSGKLTIEGVEESKAGIGGDTAETGGSITINGGYVTAKAEKGGSAIDGSAIMINGGEIKAEAVSNSGINCQDSIVIHKGTVTAKGSGAGAGISFKTALTIDSGEVTATGGEGAGIGSKQNGKCGTITINDGNIIAISDIGAGIGRGYNAGSSAITINGGNITATTNEGGAGIGNVNGGEITITGGEITVKAYVLGIASSNITIKGGCFDVESPGGGIGNMGGNCSIKITSSKIKTITDTGAGIGGAAICSNDGTIEISDSEITASAGSGAGIGGGRKGNGGTISITDSIVTASSVSGSGIGGGSEGNGGSVSITDSIITASSEQGAGIGAGSGANGHGSLSIDENNYEILSGTSESECERETVKMYCFSRQHYAKIQKNPSYTVRYLGQSEDGSDYNVQLDEVTIKGHTGDTAYAEMKNFEGFYCVKMDERKKIASDSSTAVNVYYDRHKQIHEHEFSDAWSKSDEYHWHAAVCGCKGIVNDFAKHNYDAGTISKGIKTYTCQTCGYKKTEKLSVAVPKTSIKSVKKAKKAFTVKWTKKSVTGYQIQYATNSKFTKSKKTVTVKSAQAVSKKIKKLKKKKRYYVRVRCYINKYDTTYYSGWSAKKSVRTR